MVIWYLMACLAVIGLVSTVVILFLFQKYKKEAKAKQKETAEKLAKEMISKKMDQTNQEADQLRKSARSFQERMKKQYKAQQKELNFRQDKITAKEREIKSLEQSVQDREKDLIAMQKDLKNKREDIVKTIAKISAMTQEEAMDLLKKEVDKDLVDYKAKKIKEVEEKINKQADKLAQQILVDAMQSVATDYVSEATVSVVKIPNEDVKGRIIGKDGRNIRAFEKATGVDLIMDEAPNSIGISSFDAIRRQIAKVALEKLFKDGRIHPGTIEEEVEKAKKQMNIQLRKAGKKLADRVKWYDLPEEILLLLGRFQYRSSYGQSLYKHTLEVMQIGEYLANILKADVELVRKACLLHDLGKVLTHKIKKPHHKISGDIARKFGLDEKLVNAIEAHHGDIEPQSIEAEIITLADAVSGARPGARKESLEDYVQRVEGLEKKVYEVVGDKAEEIYAVRAGREVRVMVKPDRVNDSQALVLSRKIAKAIEESNIFPGNVTVVVIREVRTSSVAK